MTVTITDPALLAQLSVGDNLVLVDPTGRVLGEFIPANWGVPPTGVKSPFSDEEMAERRKDRTGRPVADILRDLEARG